MSRASLEETVAAMTSKTVVVGKHIDRQRVADTRSDAHTCGEIESNVNRGQHERGACSVTAERNSEVGRDGGTKITSSN